MSEPEFVGLVELVRRAGITQRQADYWTRQQWIVARNPNCGHGYAREWIEEEVRVAEYMGRLVRAGVRADAAAVAARAGGRLLDPGVRIVLDKGGVR
jgi:hypothetical protein